MTQSYSLYRCAVLSTSTGSLSSVLDRDSPIQILHLGIEMGGRQYADGLDLNNQEYCDWRRTHLDDPVATTPPSEESLIKIFDYLVSQGYHEAIVTTLGSKLSETAEIVRKVARDTETLKIHVVDTGMCCMPEGFFAQEAVRLLNEGQSVENVLAELEDLKKRCTIFFGIPSARPLSLHGTMARVGARFTDWLGLKTILRFADNDLTRLGFVTEMDDMIQSTLTAAKEAIEGKNPDNLIFEGLYSGNIEYYNRFAELFEQQTGICLGKGVPVSPVVAVHVGFDCVGVGIVEKKAA